ncbi:SMP-30/gluconolactonase/LRE family protein [Streptomyces sp. NPDC001732]
MSTSPSSAALSPVDAPRCHLAESPRWDGVAWWWLDVAIGAVYRMAPGEPTRLVLRTGRRASFLAPLAPGWLVLADGTRLRRLTVADDLAVHAAPWVRLSLPEGWLLNDGCLAPDGSVWVGSVPPAGGDGRRPPDGALIRIATDGTITSPVSGFALSNGLAWTDARTLLHVDSQSGIVWRHRFDDGFTRADSTEYLRVPAEEGLPDGLAVTDSGVVWLAVYGAGEARAIRDGRTVARVPVPAAQVTAVAVGGAAAGHLLVTTAREGFDAARSAAEPAAGMVFSGPVGGVW